MATDTKNAFMNAIIMEDFEEAMQILDECTAFEVLTVVSDLFQDDVNVDSLGDFLQYVDERVEAQGYPE